MTVLRIQWRSGGCAHPSYAVPAAVVLFSRLREYEEEAGIIYRKAWVRPDTKAPVNRPLTVI